jgi:hypothetical protein
MEPDLPTRLTARFSDLTACAFCLKEKPLQISHILPAFVFRWLKETSGTPFLRNTHNPNRRVQDGEKERLLCLDCEAQFSRHETMFCNKIFHPVVSGDFRKVNYSNWFSHFLVSVSWRVAAIHLRRGLAKKLSGQKCEAIDNALQTWEKFLRHEIGSPGPFEQHVIPMGKVEDTTITDLPTNINRYMQRGVEMDMIHSDNSDLLLIYAKMGPIALFSYIIPPANKWRGTRVSINNGTYPPQRVEMPINIWNYLADRARKHQNALHALSPQQRVKIDEDVVKNLDRFRSSDHFRTIMDDYERFGPDAIIRKD